MYLNWRTKQRKFSPLGAKHHFLLLFCPPVRLHLDPRLHKREMGLFVEHPERNLRTRATSAAFHPRTCKFCCFKYNLNLCAVSELTWSSLFQSMFSRVILSEKYKATYSIGSKTNVSKSRRKKEDKRKARKRSFWLWKIERVELLSFFFHWRGHQLMVNMSQRSKECHSSIMSI